MNDQNPPPPDARPPAPYRPQWATQSHGGFGAPAPEPLAEPGAGGVDWTRIFQLLWRKKAWILAALLVGVAVGFFLARRTDPIYQTQATLWLEGSSDKSGPIQGSEVFEGEGWADLFRSRAVLEPVVRGLRLNLTVQDPAPGDSALFAGLALADSVPGGSYELQASGGGLVLSRDGSGVVARGTAGDTLRSPIGITWPVPAGSVEPGRTIDFTLSTFSDAVVHLRKRLTVLYDPQQGNLLTTRLEWNDPVEAARIHNAIVSSFMRTAFDLKTQKLREVVDILKQQTDYAGRRLDSAEMALENYRVRTITLPTEQQVQPVGGGEKTQGPVFDAYFKKKVEANQMQSDLQQLQSVLSTARSGGEIDPLALQMVPATEQSPQLQSALKELTDKEAERRSLLYQYTENYPAVQKVEQDIATLKRQTIPQALQDLVDQLRSRIAAIDGQVQAQARELQQIPTRTIEEARRRREADMAEKLHNDLLVRLKQAQLAASTNLPNLQVVDRASPPGRPARNDGPRYFLMASVAGMGLGVAGVLLFGHLDRRVRYPEQVSTSLGLPILGMVPQVKGGSASSGTEVMEVLESFRAIRAQLARRGPSRNAVVLVTSPAPRDGKSLVAANLAISYATAGQRTLLIDGDTRRGNAEQLFGLSASPGLTDYLHGRALLSEIEHATEVENLSFIGHGRLRGFDPELLDSPAMDELLEGARQRFDAVVIDGPPLIAGVDPMLLGELSDKVLMVVRTGATDQDLALSKLQEAGRFDFPVVGAVLNAVPPTAPYYSSYYRYYPNVEGEIVA